MASSELSSRALASNARAHTYEPQAWDQETLPGMQVPGIAQHTPNQMCEFYCMLVCIAEWWDAQGMLGDYID